MSDATKLKHAFEDGIRHGYRMGRIQARAELNAEWRERVSNVLAILQKPIPTQKDET